MAIEDAANSRPRDDIEREQEAIAEDEAEHARDQERPVYDISEERRSADVFVNNKPVRLAKHRTTGAEIKESAIRQGVQIDLGFQLWQEFPDGRDRQVGDTDKITVREGARFSAIAPDDNS